MNTMMFECVQCGWVGLHEHKSKRNDGFGITTDVCPCCGEESFYKNEAKLLPCEICNSDVLVQARIGEDIRAVICSKCNSALMPEDLQNEDGANFQPCEQCFGFFACQYTECFIQYQKRISQQQL